MKKTLSLLLTMLLLTLCLSPAAMASTYDPLDLTDEERAAANLFLSNFTEIGIKAVSNWSYDQDLVDFAHDHLWFNAQNSFEFGEYFSGNNCRVKDDRIQDIIDKYFYDSYDVDLAQTRFDYDGNYYYHCETGGWVPSGFAHAVNACQIEENVYFVSFLIFAGGNYWDNSVMDDSLSEIESVFDAPTGFGSALIYAEDLSDRSTYKMISYSSL